MIGESWRDDESGEAISARKRFYLSHFKDRRFQATTHVYDALNRRTAAIDADGSGTSYVYDKVNRLMTIAESIAGQIIRD